MAIKLLMVIVESKMMRPEEESGPDVLDSTGCLNGTSRNVGEFDGSIWCNKIESGGGR